MAHTAALDDLSDDDLTRWYSYPTTDRLVVRGNMISTLDGSAVGPNGLTGSINDTADHRIFEALRALADVVLVGVGTIREEGYQALRTAPPWRAFRITSRLAEHPTLAIVSSRLDLPQWLLDNRKTGREEAGGVLIVTSTHADETTLKTVRRIWGDGAVICTTSDPHGRVDLVDAVNQLAARGARRILSEGGPRLLNALAGADLLDELCLTIAPVLVGGNDSRITAGEALHQRLVLHHAITSPTSLLTRWKRARVNKTP
ncbi:MAG: dihydrofolate reductase family protein [Actinomycetota bacterium]